MVLIAQTIVDALGHTESEAVIENKVDSTCAIAGSYDSVVYCSACGAELSRKFVTASMIDHNYVNGYCTACGIKCPYTRDGDYIYFGEYPQTIKADDVTITSTQDRRGYYLGSDGCYYAKVTARPMTNITFSNGATVTPYQVYYFKVEPIRWRILTTDGETAFILCDSIIENHIYDDDSNNYAESEIRQWLNSTFYETAFTELQREIILITTVDNSLASTGGSTNPYICENTYDKVFLLSYAEATNSEYGFSSSPTERDEARQMQTIDYARTATVILENSTAYYGNCGWWLRTPSNKSICSSSGIYYDGFANYSHSSYDMIGVVPAMWIDL